MIVNLHRPADPDGLWLLFAPGCEPVGVRLPVEVTKLIEGASAYFYAEPLDEGWDIGERAPDQGW